MDTHHTSHMLQYGSVCSGIEAVSLAWEPLGLQAAWFSEVDPFPNAVLAYRYPHIPNLGDITRIADRVQNGEITAPDILVGGTPCVTNDAKVGLPQPVKVSEKIDQVRGIVSLSFRELLC
ncbi:DNA cytosine methyltransferase [Dickeya oryzae]|uniref:DNA cytosine methyltransferase n=1 Tax=Dickeya oryzae TaxID=1240404 RepID=UPI003F244912